MPITNQGELFSPVHKSKSDSYFPNLVEKRQAVQTLQNNRALIYTPEEPEGQSKVKRW